MCPDQEESRSCKRNRTWIHVQGKNNSQVEVSQLKSDSMKIMRSYQSKPRASKLGFPSTFIVSSLLIFVAPPRPLSAGPRDPPVEIEVIALKPQVRHHNAETSLQYYRSNNIRRVHVKTNGLRLWRSVIPKRVTHQSYYWWRGDCSLTPRTGLQTTPDFTCGFNSSNPFALGTCFHETLPDRKNCQNSTTKSWAQTSTLKAKARLYFFDKKTPRGSTSVHEQLVIEKCLASLQKYVLVGGIFLSLGVLWLWVEFGVCVWVLGLMQLTRVTAVWLTKYESG